MSQGIALVLSGGGARGAFQAGVVQALTEIATDAGKPRAFRVLVGVSAGALNAAFLAAHAAEPRYGSARLAALWRELTAERVYRTDLASLGAIGARWVHDVVTSPRGATRARSLLDPTPLASVVADMLPFERIGENLRAGIIAALAVSATDYRTADNVTFVQTRAPLAPWRRSRRCGVSTVIESRHVLASAAIPLLFPSVRIGEGFFGDGGLRNAAPLSPAIHLGASALVVVGVRARRVPEDPAGAIPLPEQEPTMARVLSAILNATLLDAVEADLERLDRINRTLTLVPEAQRGASGLRMIKALHISPTEDLGALAGRRLASLPRTLRYLIGGLGSAHDSADLASYLLFDPEYCGRLVDLGYADTIRRRAEVEELIAIGVPS